MTQDVFVQALAEAWVNLIKKAHEDKDSPGHVDADRAYATLDRILMNADQGPRDQAVTLVAAAFNGLLNDWSPKHKIKVPPGALYVEHDIG
jgi:hypothetical protein